MVCRCVAAGCNCTHKDGVSLFLFPKDACLRKQWADQVRRRRDKWEPTAHSVLCSKHFEQHCFESSTKLSESLGMVKKMKPRLKANAIPTLFDKGPSLKRPLHQGSSSEPMAKKRKRSAFEKRERQRLIEPFLKDDGCSSTNTSCNSEMANPIPSDEAYSCDFGMQFRPETREIGVQTEIQLMTRDSETQCCLPSSVFTSKEPLGRDDFESTESETAVESDSEYLTDSDHSNDKSQHQSDSSQTLHHHRKYIVFEDNLFSLFNKCLKCGNESTEITKKTIGTFVGIWQKCSHCSFVNHWCSQPFVKGNMPAGNIMLSAAILFSGALPSKILQVLKAFGCVCIDKRVFFKHQSSFLYPSIVSVWKQQQRNLIEELQKEKRGLILGGDGRADSPGHSAKFGSYTIMELKKQIVLDVQLVQSNEVKGSYHMEKEGLLRGVKFLQEKKFQIATLITDRHTQISKWIRENLKTTDHRYDIWHVAKSFRKKLDKASKEKDCELIGEWKKSLINHMYWSAASTASGKGDFIKAKWMSVDNHVHNIHRGHSKLYPKCLHKRLRRRKKKWFKLHTKSSEKLHALINNKSLLTAVTKLSPHYQTSSCEAFHSVIIHFAPKSTAFSYNGMLSRLYLACMHYNENCNKKQAQTKTGERRYAIQYPKYKKGGHIVRSLFENSTYDYVDKLFTQLWTEVKQGSTRISLASTPPPLCSSFEKPNKQVAIAKHRSRFI